jgi:hypothetical protein
MLPTPQLQIPHHFHSHSRKLNTKATASNEYPVACRISASLPEIVFVVEGTVVGAGIWIVLVPEVEKLVLEFAPEMEMETEELGYVCGMVRDIEDSLLKGNEVFEEMNCGVLEDVDTEELEGKVVGEELEVIDDELDEDFVPGVFDETCEEGEISPTKALIVVFDFPLPMGAGVSSGFHKVKLYTPQPASMLPPP